jgi:DNA-binding MarR family transcriptional regulator
VSSTPWLTDEQQRAWRAFSVMQLRLTSLLDRELRASGLTYAEYVVLAALTEHDPPRLGMSELLEVLGWERSRLSHQVSRMGRRGLLAKSVDPIDARRASVEVTTSGLSVLEQAAPDHVAVVRRHVIDCLSPAELRELGAVSQHLLDGLPPA